MSSTRQRGVALLFFLVVLGISLLVLFTGSLNANKVTLDRHRTTSQTLAQTKDALMSWSVARGDVTGNARPGELPCPDTDNDGNENYPCAAGALGRVPWKTLGIPEPKDAYGETLWYAISGAFRERTVNNNPINSDTKATLLVYAADSATLLTPAGNEAAAVVFSPGQAIGGQSRATVAEINDPGNYLDSAGGRNNAATGGPFIAGANSGTFNDELTFITAKELISALERRVAGELANMLAQYHATNGFYPYPAKYNNFFCTSTSTNPLIYAQCISDTTQCRGRLPQTASPNDWDYFPDWFHYNLWNQVIYYAVATSGLQTPPLNCSPILTVDGSTSTTAVFFMPGSPLGSTTRLYSNSLSDYLEDAVNQDGWTGTAPSADSYLTPSSASNDLLRKLP